MSNHVCKPPMTEVGVPSRPGRPRSPRFRSRTYGTRFRLTVMFGLTSPSVMPPPDIRTKRADALIKEIASAYRQHRRRATEPSTGRCGLGSQARCNSLHRTLGKCGAHLGWVLGLNLRIVRSAHERFLEAHITSIGSERGCANQCTQTSSS